MSVASQRPWYRRVFPLLSLSGLLFTGSGIGYLSDLAVQRLVMPRRYPAEDWMNAITVQPQKSGFRIQRFSVETADHLALQAMILEPTSASGTTTRGQVIVRA